VSRRYWLRLGPGCAAQCRNAASCDALQWNTYPLAL